MSLRLKIVPLVACCLVFYLVAEAVIRETVTAPRFVELSRQRVDREIRRFHAACDRELHHLDLLCRDWASWDDTYRFVVEPDPAYEDSNLLRETFVDNNLSVLIILDDTGQVVWGEVRQPDHWNPVSLAEFPLDEWPLDHLLLARRDPGAPLAGVILTEAGAMLTASRPILTSEEQGPACGWFIMGRLLTAAYIQTLAAQVQMPSQVWPIRGAAIPAEDLAALDEVRRQGAFLMRYSGGQPAVAWSVYHGLDREPALLIRADLPADELGATRNALRWQTALSALAGLLTLLLVSWLLDLRVLRPLQELQQYGEEVARTGKATLTTGAAPPRDDEIGQLRVTIDRMVRAVAEQARQRGQAEQVSSRHERQLQILFDTSPVGLLVVLTDGRVARANATAAAVFGAPDSAALAELQLLAPGGESGLADEFRQALATEQVQVTTRRHRSRWGRQADLRLHLAPLREPDGQLLGLQAIVEDISEQRQMEERLRQAGKMEVVGLLAGGVAHDFNNLLTSILGFADQARGGLDADHPSRPALAQVALAAERGAQLTSQLLAFSRQQVFNVEPLDLNLVVREMAELLDRLAGEPVRVKLDLPAAPCVVSSDRGALEQILMNLVVNARDAMPDGGQVTVATAARVRSSPHDDLGPREFIELLVADTGHGMDEQTRGRIFEPFFTTKERGRGTGLGLATVYGNVRQAGGFIECDTQLGVGTTFRVYLPAAMDEVAPAPTAASEALRDGHERILLVEDERPVLALLEQALSQYGYQVTALAEPQAALDHLANDPEPVDLLVSDVVMPQMTGFELAATLRASRPDLPVVLISGYSDWAQDDSEDLPPRTVMLRKPFRPSHLAAQIRALLDRDG